MVETTTRQKIVLADDNAPTRDHVRRLLTVHYDVFSAEDGKEALRLIAEQSPDLVLTGAMRPPVDGYRLLQALRSDARTVSIPVIMLSARAGEQSALDAGADDYLERPFS